LIHTEQLGCLHSAVACNDRVAPINEDRIRESKGANAFRDLSDLGFGMGPGVLRVCFEFSYAAVYHRKALVLNIVRNRLRARLIKSWPAGCQGIITQGRVATGHA
jgi:hypothetical protein